MVATLPHNHQLNIIHLYISGSQPHDPNPESESESPFDIISVYYHVTDTIKFQFIFNRTEQLHLYIRQIKSQG